MGVVELLGALGVVAIILVTALGVLARPAIEVYRAIRRRRR